MVQGLMLRKALRMLFRLAASAAGVYIGAQGAEASQIIGPVLVALGVATPSTEPFFGKGIVKVDGEV